MTDNKLQIHPTNSKHMHVCWIFIYNINNKISRTRTLINNVTVSRVTSFKGLGVKFDENLKWDNHIELICSKLGAGIATQVFTNYL